MAAEAEETERCMRVLLGVTGSVAAIKVPELVQMLTALQDPKVINTLVVYNCKLAYSTCS